MSAVVGVSTINAPELRSLRSEDIVAFHTEYEMYVKRIAQLNRAGGRYQVLQHAGAKSCVPAELLSSMVVLGVFKDATDANEVTDDEVLSWVKEKAKMSVTDTPRRVRAALSGISFSFDRTDPEGSILNLFAEITTELRRAHVANVITESGNVLIPQVIAKLEPRQLREEIQESYQYWSSDDKSSFKHFMKEVSKTAMEFAKFIRRESRNVGNSAANAPSPHKMEKSGRKFSIRTKAKAASRQQPASADTSRLERDRRHPSVGRKRGKFANWTEECLNPSCREIHPVRDCPNTTDERKAVLLQEYREKKRKRVSTVKKCAKLDASESNGRHNSRYTVSICETIEETALGDSGSDINAVPMRVLTRLREAGLDPKIERFSKKRSFASAVHTDNPPPFTSSMRIRIEVLRVRLPCGPLRLRNIDCWVIDQDMDEIILGRPLLQCIGFDLDTHLTKVRAEIDNLDVAERLVNETNEANEAGAAANGTTRVHTFRKYKGLWHDERECDPIAPLSTAGANIGYDSEAEVKASFDAVLANAKDEGMTVAGLSAAGQLLGEFRDVFRIKLGPDAPAKLDPLQIKLKPGAKPVRSTQRRYAPAQRSFLTATIKKLTEVGAVYPNPAAKWASPALAVPKSGGEGFRFTVDLRAPNRETIPVASAMPDLEGIISSVSGSTVFAKLDMCHAYWQVPLHELSRECMSIQTPIGVYTPTRILQGSTDAGNHFQATTASIFASLSANLLQWLDDFLLHAASESELLSILRKFFERCRDTDLKLHAEKIELFRNSARFCGRIIDATGVVYDPSGLEALVNMGKPEKADQLQQFICATNWMRCSIPDYANVIAPLHSLMESCYAKVGKRTKRAIKNVSLSGLWGAVHTKAFGLLKSQIARSTKLAHPRAGWTKCLFSDASETHWASLLSQVRPEQMSLDVSQQEHEPLAFLSGSFTGSALKWSTVEKEGYAVLESMQRLDHITSMEEISIFTDHSNLQYIFDPVGRNPGIRKQVAHKLFRWALKLSAYRYAIEYLKGDQNVWADLLTRWAAVPSVNVRTTKINAVLYAPINPSARDDCEWPSRKCIRSSQQKSNETPPRRFSLRDNLFQNGDGVFWIPCKDDGMKMRILVAAHTGIAGHRRSTQTAYHLSKHFYWNGMSADVATFCQSCIHCLATDSSERVPRPMGHSLLATKPNEVLHFDYCWIPKSSCGKQYVLVLKDGMSSFVKLYACESADAETTSDALCDWFSTFSIAKYWVSDQGPHFKNELIRLLREKLRCSHHFTLPYCPWTNGTVEVVCREMTKCMRALLSEYSLPFREWPSLLPLVQAALNSTPIRRLGGHCPSQAFMCMDPVTPLSEIKVGKGSEIELVTIREASVRQRNHIASVHSALENMHSEVNSASNAARDRRVQSHNRKTNVRACNLEEGEFVLRAVLKARRRNKLGAQWTGPFRICRVLSDYLFELENLLTGERQIVHGTRIKRFRNSDYRRCVELDEYLAFQAGEYCVVDELLDVRQVENGHEFLVRWKGFPDELPQWEPWSTLHEDVPSLVSEYLQDIAKSGTSRQRKIAAKLMAASP